MTNKAIAELLGISLRQVTNLKKETGYPGNKSGETEILKWFNNRELEKSGLSNKAKNQREELLKEQTRLTAAKRKLAELELKTQAANLVPMSEAKEAIYRTQLALRIQLEALGSRIGASCNPSDPALAKTVIDEAIGLIFENLQKE